MLQSETSAVKLFFINLVIKIVSPSAVYDEEADIDLYQILFIA